jgi:acyl-CoA synthetase (NDP forming)
MLWPKSVAVVGASNDLHGLRGRILEVMLSHPYAGDIYPVSRSLDEVQGVKAYKTIADCPKTPDLAILIIPAQFIPDELERCGRAGVKAAVILSSGFAEEPGETGSRMQSAIRATAQRYDMAVSGPNTEGFSNLAAALCPTFSPAMDKAAGPLLPSQPLGQGQISVISQSGGLGFAFFDRARERNITFRYIATTGNEAALEVCDFVDYMLDEGGTDVFLLLLEDIKSPEKFRRIAGKALKAGKPLIIAKIGQTEPGKRAVMSHTAALAGSHDAYRAMFRRHGVIEGRDFDEMIDFAVGFLACKDKMPAGKRMGVCTSSGGAGVWMADACVRAGLSVPELEPDIRAQIDIHLPSYGTSQNPVDTTAQGVHKVGYAAFARLVAQSPSIDGIVMVVTARRSAFLADDQARLIALAKETAKPVFLWTYTLPAAKSVEIVNGAGYPLFTNADNCARTMQVMADYRTLREQLLGPVKAEPGFASDRTGTAKLLAAAPPVLSEWRARPLLATYGIGGHDGAILARSAAEALVAARNIGRPVALKVQSGDLPHKSEAGAVALNVSAEDAAKAFERILAAAKAFAPHAAIEGVLVQPMAKPGRELILGIKTDPQWGPLLMVGLGGIAVEALGNVALAPVPITLDGAQRLLGELPGADKILGTFRGAPAADTEALCGLIVRLSQFAADHADDISEIDLNPVVVHAKGGGVSVVDALIVKRQPAQTRRAAE